jgi:hypothetical protein
MTRDRSTFRLRDLKAVLKAVRDDGMSISRIVLRHGNRCIEIIPGTPDASDDDEEALKSTRYMREAIERLNRS